MIGLAANLIGGHFIARCLLRQHMPFFDATVVPPFPWGCVFVCVCVSVVHLTNGRVAVLPSSSTQLINCTLSLFLAGGSGLVSQNWSRHEERTDVSVARSRKRIILSNVFLEVQLTDLVRIRESLDEVKSHGFACFDA